jgi:hypothetical protein
LLIHEEVVRDVSLLRPFAAEHSLLVDAQILLEGFVLAFLLTLLLLEMLAAVVFILILKLKVGARAVYNIAEHF